MWYKDGRQLDKWNWRSKSTIEAAQYVHQDRLATLALAREQRRSLMPSSQENRFLVKERWHQMNARSERFLTHLDNNTMSDPELAQVTLLMGEDLLELIEDTLKVLTHDNQKLTVRDI